MLVLESTDVLEVITSTANALDVVASYADNAAATFTPDKQATTIAAAATTTILGSPAALTTRNVSNVGFFARGGANTLTVRFNNGAAFQILSVALASGERLEYENGAGWRVLDPSGQFKQSIAAGAGSIALTSLATQAANTIVANATAGVASPTAVAVSAQALLLRAAGNLTDTVAGNDTVLCRNGAGNLGFTTIVTNNIANNAVTNAKAAQMAARTAKGNNTNGAADPIDLTADQVRECFAGACLTQTTSQTQTASVTNLTIGTYSIPANMMQVGSMYEAQAQYYAGRGATVTATSLIIELLVNGAVIRTLTIVINVTASAVRSGMVTGRISIRTTGAGGTAMITLAGDSDLPSAAAGTSVLSVDPAPAAAAPATTAIDTTVARTVELRMRLSAATATVFVHMLHCKIEKVR